jgi:hypothetical protein
MVEPSWQANEVLWQFVAMEYFAFILNRTFAIAVTDRMLCGAYVHGPIPSPPLVTHDWLDPHFYFTGRLEQYARVNVQSPEFLKLHRANFQYELREIMDVQFDASPKWGMGNVPYSGRVHIRFRNGRHRELILVGEQDGPAVVGRLRMAAFRPRSAT